MNGDLLVTAKSTKPTVQEEGSRELTGPHLHGREATQAQFSAPGSWPANRGSVHPSSQGCWTPSLRETMDSDDAVRLRSPAGADRRSDPRRPDNGQLLRLEREARDDRATIVRPDTILAWFRRPVARKFGGSPARRTPGRPRSDRAVEQLIVCMAKEKRSSGDDRIVGVLANLGHEISDQTVGNVLRRHGLPPAPKRKHTTTWPALHSGASRGAGGDGSLLGGGPHAAWTGNLPSVVFHPYPSREPAVEIAGVTTHPTEQWMQQMARNVTMEGCGALRDCRYLPDDRDRRTRCLL